MLQMHFDIVQVEVLHITKGAVMEKYHKGDYLTMTHFWLPLGLISQGMFLNRLIKMMAEFIYEIENIGNFIAR